MMKNKLKKIYFFSVSIVIASILLFSTVIVSAENCAPSPYPAGRIGHSMVYDSVNDVIIVYGGATGPYDLDRKYDTQAYDYNNNNWTNLNPATHPYPSSWGAMAYDSESEKIVQFGGVPQNDWASNETWIYDPALNTWTEASPNDFPAMRSAHVMAYDSESDVVILHGGALNAEDNPDGVYVHYNDTWAYDLNSDTWTDMNPTGLDVGITEGQMTYDSESDRCILVGGYYVYPYADPLDEYYATETWAYDYNSNTWENITTTIHPGPRFDHAVAYDSESDRVILSGGHKLPGDDTLQAETWAFDYNTETWENMDPTYSPKRLAHKLVYDSESDLVILFGGIDYPDLTDVFYNTIITYDYNTNTWTIMPKEICEEESIVFSIPIISSLAILAIVLILRRKK